MIRVLANLRKSWISIITIIILLCIQAVADLSLPDYTSKIVNIGIQQGGIENSSPEVIRKSSMDDVLLFTEDDEKILDSYTLISKENLDEKDYEKYLKKYPELEHQELYILNKLDEEDQDELNDIIAKPLMIAYNLSYGETEQTIKSKILENIPEEYKSQLEDKTALEILKSSGEKIDSELLKDAEERISTLPESMLTQAAVTAVKEEYKQVGINLDDYQNNYIVLTGLQMLGVAFISVVTAVLIMLLSSRVAAKLGRTLRDRVFKKVLNFSTGEFKQFSTASLITRSTNDVQQIQMLITILFRVVIYAPIMGIGGFLKVLTTSNNTMSWIIGVAIFGVLFVVMNLFIIAMPKFKKLQDLIDKLNLVSREILTGLPVIRAFNKERQKNQDLKKQIKI